MIEITGSIEQVDKETRFTIIGKPPKGKPATKAEVRAAEIFAKHMRSALQEITANRKLSELITTDKELAGELGNKNSCN